MNADAPLVHVVVQVVWQVVAGPGPGPGSGVAVGSGSGTSLLHLSSKQWQTRASWSMSLLWMCSSLQM